MIRRIAAGCMAAIWLCTAYGGLPASADEQVSRSIVIEIDRPAQSAGARMGEDPAGGGPVLLTDEEGFVEWSFEAPGGEEYELIVQVYPLSGRGVTIERRLLLNGVNLAEQSGAQTIAFSRIWKDAGAPEVDNAGNQLRPEQTEAPAWREVTVKNRYGDGTLLLRPQKGRNTLRLEAVREPMAIRKITLEPATALPTYREYARATAGRAAENAGEQLVKQAEEPLYKSEASLYAINDRTSAYTQPSDPSRIRLNTIGGTKWKYPGQWITWSIPVEKAGYYTLSLRCRQNLISGQSSSRCLYVDDRLLFSEAQELEFVYDTDWQVVTLGDENGAYLFYLTPGDHTFRMEVTIGSYAQPIEQVSEAVDNLNEAYRQILMITGSQPDPNRDYYLDKELPEVMRTLTQESGRLKQAVESLRRLSGGRSGILTAAPERVYNRIDDMLADTDKIPAKFADFKETLVALGSWLLSIREQPLEVDYLLLSAPDTETPRAEGRFYERFLYSCRTFLATFFNDYSTAGNTYDGNEALTVWLATGRDQAQTLRQLVDNDFAPRHGVGANVRLVPAGTLLSAVLAGVGPDISLGCLQSDPVNYALRRAVADLAAFPDFDEVAGRFYESALVPFRLNGGVYALPETQSFPMLFYRTDILRELGIQKPETWEDVLRAIPVLQKKNMQFGIGSELNSFGMLLYQAGGAFYNEAGTACTLDSETALAAFKKWTGFYTSYSLPVSYDFANRFRTGEMPIGIMDYSTYNLLSVFAPEIEGLWAFAQVPGTRLEDGSVDRTVPSTGIASVILRGCRRQEDAWTFLKWWTSADVQARYGTELEMAMGASARYATANTEALRRMPWSAREADTIEAQWDAVRAIPEVPGGYFLTRQVTFAFRSVVVSGNDPRESLLDYTEAVNEEIVKKRREFAGLLKEAES